MIASDSFISDCSTSTISASSISAASAVRNRVAIDGGDLLHRRKPAGGAAAPARRREMRLDAIELKGHRTRIVGIEHDEVDHRRAAPRP